MVVVEEVKLDPNRVSDLESKIDKLDRYFHVLDEGLEHERSQHQLLELTLQAHFVKPFENGSKSLYSMLEYEWKYHALRDELSSAHRGFEDFRTRNENFQIQHENLVPDHKNLLGILEKGGQIRPRKKPRTISTGGADQHKT